MALTQPITFADGTSVPSAYMQAYIEGTATSLTVRLQIWTDQSMVSQVSAKQVVSFPGFVPDPASAQSLFAQAYAWIKTKPGFTNAVNV